MKASSLEHRYGGGVGDCQGMALLTRLFVDERCCFCSFCESLSWPSETAHPCNHLRHGLKFDPLAGFRCLSSAYALRFPLNN